MPSPTGCRCAPARRAPWTPEQAKPATSRSRCPPARTTPCSSPPTSRPASATRSTTPCARKAIVQFGMIVIASLLGLALAGRVLRPLQHAGRHGADDLGDRPHPAHPCPRRGRGVAHRHGVQRHARAHRAGERDPTTVPRRRQPRAALADDGDPRARRAARARDRPTRTRRDGEDHHRRDRPDEPDRRGPAPARPQRTARLPVDRSRSTSPSSPRTCIEGRRCCAGGRGASISRQRS